jgi:hypothetical protein
MGLFFDVLAVRSCDGPAVAVRGVNNRVAVGSPDRLPDAWLMRGFRTRRAEKKPLGGQVI